MFFKTSRSLVTDVHLETKKGGAVQAFMFRVYCFTVFAAFVFWVFVFSLGLPEIVSWSLWAVGVAPVLFFYVLWEQNIPAGATYLWPKVWYVRGRKIWPRQK